MTFLFQREWDKPRDSLIMIKANDGQFKPKRHVAFVKSNGTIVGNKQGHGLVTGDVVYISAEKDTFTTPQYQRCKISIWRMS